MGSVWIERDAGFPRNPAEEQAWNRSIDTQGWVGTAADRPIKSPAHCQWSEPRLQAAPSFRQVSTWYPAGCMASPS